MLDTFAMYLDIPRSQQQKALEKFANQAQRIKENYWKYWLDHHPTPSWMVVVESLWILEEYDILERVWKDFYMKGQT